MHILITMSCFKAFRALQNQSFSSFAPLVCLFLVTASGKSVLNYVLKMFIIFAFCMISLPHSSRYVLIDISNLTHFLCRNLFVMSCLIPQQTAISVNVLEIRLTLLSFTPYRWLMPSQIPCTFCHSDFRECSQNSRKLPCGTAFLKTIIF